MIDINPICTMPIQPPVSDEERKHPRFAEYQDYVAALNSQLVTAAPFAAWLRSKEEFEQGREIVFQTSPGATIPQGWYKHVFLPRRLHPIRLGPFPTESLAQAAVLDSTARGAQIG